MEHGADPGISFHRAIDSFAQAIKVNASNPSVHNSLGNLYLNLAAYQSAVGVDVRPTLGSAIEAYSRAIQLNPSNPMPHLNCGTAFVQLCEYDLQVGQDPRKNLELAREHLLEALRVNPGFARVLGLIGRTYVAEAAYELKQRLPLSSSASGKKWLEDALSKNPKEADAHRHLGRLDLLQARWHVMNGKSPESYFDRAAKALSAALAIDPDPENYSTLADVYRWKAQWRANASDIQSGLDMTAKALALNPNLAAAHAIRGSLLRVRSRITGDPAAEQQARESLRRAWEINPRLGEDYESPAEPMPRSR